MGGQSTATNALRPLVSVFFSRFLGTKATALLVLSSVLGVASGLLELAMAGALQVVVLSLGLMSDPKMLPFGLSSINWSVERAAALLLGVGTARLIVGFWGVNTTTIARALVNLRLKLFLVCEAIEGSNGESMTVGDAAFRLSSQIPQEGDAARIVFSAVVKVLEITVLLVSMLAITRSLSFVGLAGLGVIALIGLKFTRMIRRRSPSYFLTLEGFTRDFTAAIRNWIYLRVMRLEGLESRKLKEKLRLSYHQDVAIDSILNFSSSFTAYMGVLVVIVLILVGKLALDLPGSEILSVLYLFVRFSQQLSQLVSLHGAFGHKRDLLVSSLVHLARLDEAWLNHALALDQGANASQEVLKREDSVSLHRESKHNRGHASSAPAIEAKELSFSYGLGDSPEILKGVSFNIPAGSSFGIRGPSGSGKSTLLGLILGIRRPTMGQVFVNGQQSHGRDGEAADLAIGYVGPEPFIIAGTLRKNLCYGLSEDISDDEIWSALSRAATDKEIRSLPKGLDHLLHENGEGLSAGQKQRLCLARAFLRKPQLLVLDEASANIDEQTERYIVDSLRHAKIECTMVIVSHRPAMFTLCDQILDLERREITRQTRV